MGGRLGGIDDTIEDCPASYVEGLSEEALE